MNVFRHICCKYLTLKNVKPCEFIILFYYFFGFCIILIHFWHKYQYNIVWTIIVTYIIGMPLLKSTFTCTLTSYNLDHVFSVCFFLVQWLFTKELELDSKCRWRQNKIKSSSWCLLLCQLLKICTLDVLAFATHVQVCLCVCTLQPCLMEIMSHNYFKYFKE